MKKSDDYNVQAPLSTYARFYFKYIGYSFIEIGTGKKYTKGDLWDYFNKEAKATLLVDDIIEPEGFHIIKNNTNTKN